MINRTIIGIDPGYNGGICCINKDGMRVEVMPVIKTKAEKTKKGKLKKKKRIDVDEHLLRAYLISMAGKRTSNCMAVIEAVHSMPGNGGCAMFSFGTCYGIIKGMLVGLGIPYVSVTPMVWQKATCGKKKHCKHKPSVAYCISKYPYLDLRESKRCKNPHDGMTDAICIAEWAAKDHQFLTKIN